MLDPIGSSCIMLRYRTVWWMALGPTVGSFVGVILGESRSFEVRPSGCWDVFPRLPVIPPVGGTGGLNGMVFFGGVHPYTSSCLKRLEGYGFSGFSVSLPQQQDEMKQTYSLKPLIFFKESCILLTTKAPSCNTSSPLLLAFPTRWA